MKLFKKKETKKQGKPRKTLLILGIILGVLALAIGLTSLFTGSIILFRNATALTLITGTGAGLFFGVKKVSNYLKSKNPNKSRTKELSRQQKREQSLEQQKGKTVVENMGALSVDQDPHAKPIVAESVTPSNQSGGRSQSKGK